MRASVLERTVTWRHGDPVSIVFDGRLFTGTAIVWTRQSDDKRFVKVELTNGPRAGNKIWATEGWMLGVGEYERPCVDCRLPFRTNDQHADFCPVCQRHQRQDGDVGSLSRFGGVRWQSERRGVGRRGRMK